jgi:hypothetical protein
MNTLTTAHFRTNESAARICFALFVAGALLGLIQLSGPVSFGAGFEMVSIAKNLSGSGNFSNPFEVLNTGPTAANPPLYPVFLAIFMKVFRIPALVLLVASVGNIVMNAVTASLLPRISQLFFGNMVPGIAASVFWLASMQLMPAWDTTYTVAGLLAFCLCSASAMPQAGQSVARSVSAGIIAGLLFLLNPSTLMVLVPWVLYLCLRRRLGLKEGAIVLILLSLTAFGWMARNRRELGAFVVRTNMGITLYASNNDCAEANLVANESQDCYQSHSPNTSLPEAQLLRSMGEVKYDKMRVADAKLWMKTHPERFRALTTQRFRDFWFPPMKNHAIRSGAIWVATAFSIPGLAWMIRRREPVTLFVLVALIFYPLMYYIAASAIRYRYPVLWLSLLPAGYFIQQLLPAKLKILLDGAVQPVHPHSLIQPPYLRNSTRGA